MILKVLSVIWEEKQKHPKHQAIHKFCNHQQITACNRYYNSGTDVIAIKTNFFGFKAYFIRWNPYLLLLTSPKTWNQIRHGSRGNFILLFCWSNHSIQLFQKTCHYTHRLEHHSFPKEMFVLTFDGNQHR